ncbi:LPS-assembly protein LptD [bacterium]|nr:LPS-assembly protein LptD [bacterium]
MSFDKKLFLFLLLSSPVLSSAQSTGERFTHKSDTFRTDFETNVTIMEGDVFIESNERRLTSDKMEIMGKTGQILCSGNVTYNQGSLSVSAESGEMNIKSGLGTFKNAVLQFGDQLYLEGKYIDRYEENRYRVRHGKLSLCQDCPQTWSIAGSVIDVEIEGYAEVHHALVQVKDTPVAYIPIFIFPIKSKRQSGMLPPKFKSEKDMGFQMGVPYFWAISNDADTTIELRPMTKGGQRVWNEFRYKYSDRSFIDGHWSVNRNNLVDTLPSVRWGSSFEERIQISPSLVQRYTGEWASDTRYSGHFEEDFRRSRLPQLVHDFNFTYQKPNLFALAGARFNRDNVPRVLNKDLPQGLDQKPVQSYPDLSLINPSYRLLGPLRMDVDSQYLSLRRPYDENSPKVSGSIDPETGFIRTGDRATMQVSLVAPIGSRYLSYRPEIGSRIDFYSFHQPVYPGSTYRVRSFIDQELSTEVWRVFNFDDRVDLKAVKHSVRPFVRWSFSPEDVRQEHPSEYRWDSSSGSFRNDHPFFTQRDDQGRKSPKFDLFDPNSDAESVSLGTISEEQRLGHHHLLTLGLGTRVVGRYGDERRRYEEHFGANVSQDFNLLPEGERLGRILFDAFGAYSGWRLSTNMAIDPRTRNADVLNKLQYSKYWYSANVFQSIQRGNQSVGGGGSLNDIGAFSFSFLSKYDLVLNDWIEQEYSFLYKSPSKCWLVQLTTRSTDGWWPVDPRVGIPTFSLDVEYRPEAPKSRKSKDI